MKWVYRTVFLDWKFPYVYLVKKKKKNLIKHLTTKVCFLWQKSVFLTVRCDLTCTNGQDRLDIYTLLPLSYTLRICRGEDKSRASQTEYKRPFK